MNGSSVLRERAVLWWGRGANNGFGSARLLLVLMMGGFDIGFGEEDGLCDGKHHSYLL
jgi:hypothetical protein